VYFWAKSYEACEIEDFRCTLPLTNDNSDMYPLGFGLNTNSRKSIELGTFGEQPASPLVLIFTDTGLLVTFYLVNMQSKDRSICQEAKQMKYRHVPQQAPQPAGIFK
jgi:hypothetical protein